LPRSHLRTSRHFGPKENGKVTTMAFTCNICEEESTRICVSCTKDSCENHLCEKCSRCSDCCSCEVRLDDDERNHQARSFVEPESVVEPIVARESDPARELVQASIDALESVAGTEPLSAPEPLGEPAGIPAEDVAREAPDIDIPG